MKLVLIVSRCPTSSWKRSQLRSNFSQESEYYFGPASIKGAMRRAQGLTGWRALINKLETLRCNLIFSWLFLLNPLSCGLTENIRTHGNTFTTDNFSMLLSFLSIFLINTHMQDSTLLPYLLLFYTSLLCCLSIPHLSFFPLALSLTPSPLSSSFTSPYSSFSVEDVFMWKYLWQTWCFQAMFYVRFCVF